jgi:hypothetical protein
VVPPLGVAEGMSFRLEGVAVGLAELGSEPEGEEAVFPPRWSGGLFLASQRMAPTCLLVRMVSLIIASFQTALSWVLNRVIQLGVLKWVRINILGLVLLL